VCDCSDQAAHYHNLGPKLGASLLTRHIGWKQKKKRKKEKSATDNIFVMHNIFLKCHEYNAELYNLCIDFKQAFDTVNRKFYRDYKKQEFQKNS
jgi:hypothetical protein